MSATSGVAGGGDGRSASAVVHEGWVTAAFVKACLLHATLLVPAAVAEAERAAAVADTSRTSRGRSSRVTPGAGGTSGLVRTPREAAGASHVPPPAARDGLAAPPGGAPPSQYDKAFQLAIDFGKHYKHKPGAAPVDRPSALAAAQEKHAAAAASGALTARSVSSANSSLAGSSSTVGPNRPSPFDVGGVLIDRPGMMERPGNPWASAPKVHNVRRWSASDVERKDLLTFEVHIVDRAGDFVAALDVVLRAAESQLVYLNNALTK